MMIQFKLSLAEWDNANRTNKFTSGRKHCMESGVWIGKRPIGYNKVGKSINTEYTINETVKLIRKAFKEEIPNTTKIIIAQRVASIMDADKIVVMDGGKIVGVGTHTDLYATNEIYREVYDTQNKSVDDEEKLNKEEK